jgi:hypothetical protein
VAVSVWRSVARRRLLEDRTLVRMRMSQRRAVENPRTDVAGKSMEIRDEKVSFVLLYSSFGGPESNRKEIM